jgi:CubicO group peptidase (beta-lactamase class C family)
VPESEDPADFLAFLDATIPGLMEELEIPGVSVALVAEGVVYAVRGYGVASRATGAPVEPDTGFRVGSISKPLTAVGVMRLHEEGKLRLDAPAERYIARWRLPPSEFDRDGVTIRRLLTHTAGLSLDYIAPFGPDEELSTLEAALSGATRGHGAVRVVAEPGSGFRYLGGGYMLLQLVIEEVTGRSFEAYMQKEVLEPLGMVNSTFKWTPAPGPSIAVGHDDSDRQVPNYRYTGTAAAGLYSTAGDLARFVAALADRPPGGRVLRPETVKLMREPAAESGEEGIARGVFFLDRRSGLTVAGHAGSDVGWNAKLLVLPERHQGIVVLTNSDRGAHLHGEIGCSWIAWATRKSLTTVCP